MAERISETLQKKLSERLGFYEDLGISLFYRDRCAVEAHDRERQLESQVPAHFSTPDRQKEVTLPKPATKPTFRGTQLFLATEIPRLNSFLSAKARAPMKTRKGCRSLAARGNF